MSSLIKKQTKKNYSLPFSSLAGQPQQAVSQMGRGQPSSTPMPASTPVQTTAAQRAAGVAPSPQVATTAPAQSPVASSQPNRPQQGQVKLTMAQLMQLTQGAQVGPHFYGVSSSKVPPLVWNGVVSLSAEGKTPFVCNSAGRKPGSDGGDPGSGPDPGTVADHPTGCDNHPWSWSATNAGCHAQWPGPTLPFHSHAPLLITFNSSANCSCPHKACCSSDVSNSRSIPSPDYSFSTSPNSNGCPCTCTNTCSRPSSNTNATFGPNSNLSSCAIPSHQPIINSSCTISTIHFCACTVGPDLDTGFILYTSLCPRTTPRGKTCSCPSAKCSLSFGAKPSTYPYPRLVPHANPNCSVSTCSSCTSFPAPNTCLQPCPSLNLSPCSDAHYCSSYCPCFSPSLKPL